MVQQTTLIDFGPFVESLIYGAEQTDNSSLDELCLAAWEHPGRQEIEQILGHTFKKPKLLITALTHRSIVSETKSMTLKSYERLEFLGDALLDLLVSERLMSEFKTLSEGELSKFRSTLVNEEALDDIASNFKLGRFLILGRGERQAQGHQRAGARADIFESILAAVYLDEGHGDFAYLRAIFERLINKYERTGAKFFDLARLNHFDPKTTLQEKTMQALSLLPQYESSEKEGGFQTDVSLEGHPLASAWAQSKKKASKEAAKLALDVVDQIILKIKKQYNEGDSTCS